jgi:hypothetical protein
MSTSSHRGSQSASGTVRDPAHATPPMNLSEELIRSSGVMSMSNRVCTDLWTIRAEAAKEAVERLVMIMELITKDKGGQAVQEFRTAVTADDVVKTNTYTGH